jgi:hypothetical protein
LNPKKLFLEILLSVEIAPCDELFSFLHSLQGTSEGNQYVLTQQGKLLMFLPRTKLSLAFSLSFLLNYDFLLLLMMLPLAVAALFLLI